MWIIQYQKVTNLNKKKHKIILNLIILFKKNFFKLSQNISKSYQNFYKFKILKFICRKSRNSL